jgi:hypothetical protein
VHRDKATPTTVSLRLLPAHLYFCLRAPPWTCSKAPTSLLPAGPLTAINDSHTSSKLVSNALLCLPRASRCIFGYLRIVNDIIGYACPSCASPFATSSHAPPPERPSDHIFLLAKLLRPRLRQLLAHWSLATHCDSLHALSRAQPA